MIIEAIGYLLAGSFAGILAGTFGVGGGIIIVPVLVLIFGLIGFDSHYIVHLAIGTSLASIFFTGISSTRSHFLKGGINFQAFYPVAFGISIGSIVGVLIANNLSADVLKYIIGIFALFIAAQMHLVKENDKTFRASKGISFAVGSGVGSISTILGIGGGSFTVPFFRYSGLDMKTCVGTGAACGIPIALFGSLTFAILGLENSDLPNYSIGYIYLPALIGISASSIFTASIGATIAHSISDKMLSMLFSLMMITISMYMLFTS